MYKYTPMFASDEYKEDVRKFNLKTKFIYSSIIMVTKENKEVSESVNENASAWNMSNIVFGSSLLGSLL